MEKREKKQSRAAISASPCQIEDEEQGWVEEPQRSLCARVRRHRARLQSWKRWNDCDRPCEEVDARGDREDVLM
jgi:hypothetical protein